MKNGTKGVNSDNLPTEMAVSKIFIIVERGKMSPTGIPPRVVNSINST